MLGKKILITGGAGFIGSNLALRLQADFSLHQIFVIDNFSSGNYENLIGFNGQIIPLSVNEIDLERYFPEGVDVIFHQAAITDTTFFDQQKMMKENVESFYKIIDFAKKTKTKVVYASSAAVYGHSNPPMEEGVSELPANIYGFSKLAMDNIAKQNFNNLDIIGLRYFNVYGPREAGKGKMASMIWQIYNQVKNGQEPKLFKNGEQARDQVYVEDVVKANILAWQKGKTGIYNIGSGKSVSFNEILDNINRFLNTNTKAFYIENPFNHYQQNTLAQLTKAGKDLGYFPEYNISKGIEHYLNYLKKYDTRK